MKFEMDSKIGVLISYTHLENIILEINIDILPRSQGLDIHFKRTNLVRIMITHECIRIPKCTP